MEDEEDEETPGDALWTLDSLYTTDTTLDCLPTATRVRKLVDLYHRMWVDPNLSVPELGHFLWKRLRLDEDHEPEGEEGDEDDEEALFGRRSGPSLFSWSVFLRKLQHEHGRYMRLLAVVQALGLQDDPLLERMKEIAKVLFDVTDYVKQAAQFTLRINTAGLSSSSTVVLDRDMFDLTPSPTFLNHEKDSNTNFQRLFLYLCQVLESCGYRRSQDAFFTRVITRSGHFTLAFEWHISISDFVKQHVDKVVKFEAFQWASNPPNNAVAVVQWMTHHNLAEAPDLNETMHLRSYEGDEFGRGAGVYDSSTDVFFPYSQRDHWEKIARYVNDVRKRLYGSHSAHDSYPAFHTMVVVAPTALDVCTVHLDCRFPFDTLLELQEIVDAEDDWHDAERRTPLVRCWRRACSFECVHEGQILDNVERIAEWLDAALPAEGEMEEAVWGKSWTRIMHVSDHLRRRLRRKCQRICSDPLLEALRLNESRVPVKLLADVGEKTYVLDDEYDIVYLPNECPARMARVVLGYERWCDLGGAADLRKVSHHGGKRLHAIRPTSVIRYVNADGTPCFFVPHSGRGWLDCPVPDFDRIMTHQSLGLHDRFMVYALLGRLFFEVGERDNYEMTFMIEGIGGCGKTTIQKAFLKFFPAHLIGVLSPNIQPQFGMAAVLRDNRVRIIVCNEAGKSLQIMQEEWQTCVSGEFGSYAVKNQQMPLICRAKAQHFWIGNSFPSHFKNEQNQVSRRLPGVLMQTPVTERDGTLLARINNDLGLLQRRTVLAYESFRAVHGKRDPMSREESLPPAFYAYIKRGKLKSNPFEAFLRDANFVVPRDHERMELSRLRELYVEYRSQTGLPRMRGFDQDVYTSALADFGCHIVNERIDPELASTVQLVIGLRDMQRGGS